MAFQLGGGVTFWMDPQERIDTPFSHYDELQLKEKTKAELIGNIKSSGVDISVVKGERVGELQNIFCK